MKAGKLYQLTEGNEAVQTYDPMNMEIVRRFDVLPEGAVFIYLGPSFSRLYPYEILYEDGCMFAYCLLVDRCTRVGKNQSET